MSSLIATRSNNVYFVISFYPTLPFGTGRDAFSSLFLSSFTRFVVMLGIDMENHRFLRKPKSHSGAYTDVDLCCQLLLGASVVVEEIRPVIEDLR